MNEEFFGILMNLCREILLVLELEPEECITYNPLYLEQELYIFYIDIAGGSTKESLEYRCDTLRNNFTLFILSLKQHSSESVSQKQSIEESLVLVSQKLTSFINYLAHSSNEELILTELDDLITLIKHTNPQNALKSFIIGSILKEKSYIECLKLDLDSLSASDLKSKVLSLINSYILSFETSALTLMSSTSNPESLLSFCRDSSKEIGYMLASVSQT